MWPFQRTQTWQHLAIKFLEAATLAINSPSSQISLILGNLGNLGNSLSAQISHIHHHWVDSGDQFFCQRGGETWNLKWVQKTCRSQWLNSFVFSNFFQCVCCMWLQIYINWFWFYIIWLWVDILNILFWFGLSFDFGLTYWIFDFDFNFDFILFDFPTLFAALSSRLCVCASPGELSSTIITYHRDLFLIVFVLFVFVIFLFPFVLLIFSGFIFVHFFWARNAGYHHIYLSQG